MNIAVLPSSYQPHIGGVEELTRQLAIAYGRKGKHVIVVTNRWPRDLPREEVLDDIAVYRLPFRFHHRSLRSRVSYPLTNRRISDSLHTILREHEIEVLHVQCVSTNAHYALRAQRALAIPLVVTTQGELTMDAAQLFQRDPHMADLLREASEQADLVTACSAKTLLDLEHFLGHSLEGARVIHNGADVPTFADAAPLDLGYPYVLSIGRLVAQKGFDVLLRGWATLRRAPGMRLLIAGEGPERQGLVSPRRSAADRRIGGVLRSTDRATTPRLFAGSTAVVVPSRSDEGLPLVAIESLAAGRPLVTTRSGGVVEAVTDGVNGLIVERDDAPGLAAALQRIVDDPRTAAKLGRAAQDRARDFDWNVLADRYLDSFRCAIGSRAT